MRFLQEVATGSVEKLRSGKAGSVDDGNGMRGKKKKETRKIGQGIGERSKDHTGTRVLGNWGKT